MNKEQSFPINDKSFKVFFCLEIFKLNFLIKYFNKVVAFDDDPPSPAPIGIFL